MSRFSEPSLASEQEVRNYNYDAEAIEKWLADQGTLCNWKVERASVYDGYLLNSEMMRRDGFLPLEVFRVVSASKVNGRTLTCTVNIPRHLWDGPDGSNVWFKAFAFDRVVRSVTDAILHPKDYRGYEDQDG